jgi:hypothetical protein
VDLLGVGEPGVAFLAHLLRLFHLVVHHVQAVAVIDAVCDAVIDVNFKVATAR